MPSGNDHAAASDTPRYRVALFNSGDPRGHKVGGIETYIRDYIEFHPDDIDVLFIGPDETGLLPLDQITAVTFRGRRFHFLPLLYLKGSAAAYGNGIARSDTWRFAKMLWKKRALIGGILREGTYTAELRRVEYAPLLWWMRVPVIQMVHIWGDKDKPMSSALGRHWYLRVLTEFLAAGIARTFYSVNAEMTARYRRKYPLFARKFDTLTTWANPAIFALLPYAFDSGMIDILYAGRLDKFKRPDVMFDVIAAAARLRPGAVRFHYVGDGNPDDIAEFAAIRDITVQHGVQDAPAIAAILARCHVTILTSEFEGMPRVVIESLATGRPVVALHLPQLEAVIVDGGSGCLVARGPGSVTLQAAAILDVYDSMRDGIMTPESVARSVATYRPVALLARIWDDHRRLQGRRK